MSFQLHLDLLRTVLAVNGSLRRAKYGRALDRCGPFWSASRDEGKGGEWKSSVGTEPVAPWCPPIAPELAPFLRARDTKTCCMGGAGPSAPNINSCTSGCRGVAP